MPAAHATHAPLDTRRFAAHAAADARFSVIVCLVTALCPAACPAEISTLDTLVRSAGAVHVNVFVPEAPEFAYCCAVAPHDFAVNPAMVVAVPALACANAADAKPVSVIVIESFGPYVDALAVTNDPTLGVAPMIDVFVMMSAPDTFRSQPTLFGAARAATASDKHPSAVSARRARDDARVDARMPTRASRGDAEGSERDAMPEGTVFIGNIPYDATETSLRDVFGEVGPVRELRLVADRDTGKLKGYGFVEFDDYATAMSAVRNVNGREYNGRQLRVDHAETMKGEGGGGGAGGAGGGNANANAAAPGRLRADAPVGQAMAKHANQMGMRHAFEGATSATGAAMDLLTKRVADLTPTQMYEIMSQMKQMTESDPAQARTLLIQNPQLSLALFQAQLVLGMVKPPSGGAAPAPAPAPHLVGQQASRMRAAPPPPPPVRAVVPPPPAPPVAVAQPPMDQQQALLRQVLGMTPEQIAVLPPDQRAQVEYLRQLAAQQGMVRRANARCDASARDARDVIFLFSKCTSSN